MGVIVTLTAFCDIICFIRFSMFRLFCRFHIFFPVRAEKLKKQHHNNMDQEYNMHRRSGWRFRGTAWGGNKKTRGEAMVLNDLYDGESTFPQYILSPESYLYLGLELSFLHSPELYLFLGLELSLFRSLELSLLLSPELYLFLSLELSLFHSPEYITFLM